MISSCILQLFKLWSQFNKNKCLPQNEMDITPVWCGSSAESSLSHILRANRLMFVSNFGMQGGWAHLLKKYYFSCKINKNILIQKPISPLFYKTSTWYPNIIQKIQNTPFIFNKLFTEHTEQWDKEMTTCKLSLLLRMKSRITSWTIVQNRNINPTSPNSTT